MPLWVSVDRVSLMGRWKSPVQEEARGRCGRIWLKGRRDAAGAQVL